MLKFPVQLAMMNCAQTSHAAGQATPATSQASQENQGLDKKGGPLMSWIASSSVFSRGPSLTSQALSSWTGLVWTLWWKGWTFRVSIHPNVTHHPSILNSPQFHFHLEADAMFPSRPVIMTILPVGNCRFMFPARSCTTHDLRHG